MEFIKDQEKRILLSAISREKKVIKEHPELAELIPVIKQLEFYFMYDRLFKKIYEQGRADVLKDIAKIIDDYACDRDIKPNVSLEQMISQYIYEQTKESKE